ncbi:DUF742 domain-containing protein [Micromonospora profundi]|uniref:DUF742 domain-containing protein n=2 Tax=Micromonospora profundi TaxID=1420889 RepID=UPI0028A93940|nr:DUF742 domain-containing protein [Micromonospora profundi]
MVVVSDLSYVAGRPDIVVIGFEDKRRRIRWMVADISRRPLPCQWVDWKETGLKTFRRPYRPSAASSASIPSQLRTSRAPLFPEQARIVELCHHPVSVAEVAAELDLPLGTVRVLLGDLLAAGLVETHEPPTLSELPSQELLESILVGLRAL